MVTSPSPAPRGPGRSTAATPGSAASWLPSRRALSRPAGILFLLNGGTIQVGRAADGVPTLKVPGAGPDGQAWFACVRKALLSVRPVRNLLVGLLVAVALGLALALPAAWLAWETDAAEAEAATVVEAASTRAGSALKSLFVRFEWATAALRMPDLQGDPVALTARLLRAEPLVAPASGVVAINVRGQQVASSTVAASPGGPVWWFPSAAGVTRQAALVGCGANAPDGAGWMLARRLEAAQPGTAGWVASLVTGSALRDLAAPAAPSPVGFALKDAEGCTLLAADGAAPADAVPALVGLYQQYVAFDALTVLFLQHLVQLRIACHFQHPVHQGFLCVLVEARVAVLLLLVHLIEHQADFLLGMAAGPHGDEVPPDPVVARHHDGGGQPEGCPPPHDAGQLLLQVEGQAVKIEERRRLLLDALQVGDDFQPFVLEPHVGIFPFDISSGHAQVGRSVRMVGYQVLSSSRRTNRRLSCE